MYYWWKHDDQAHKLDSVFMVCLQRKYLYSDFDCQNYAMFLYIKRVIVYLMLLLFTYVFVLIENENSVLVTN